MYQIFVEIVIVGFSKFYKLYHNIDMISRILYIPIDKVGLLVYDGANSKERRLFRMEKTESLRRRAPVRWLTVTAVFMAMNIALSSFGMPVPGGHLYLNDIVICTAAILLDPVGAFAVGGLGAFLGDMFFYPAPMFVSLVTHGLQAAVISLCAHSLSKNRFGGAVLGVTLGAVIMVVGYSLGRAFVYSTPEYAILKLPFQILQAIVGAVCGIVICFPCRLTKTWDQWCQTGSG